MLSFQKKNIKVKFFCSNFFSENYLERKNCQKSHFKKQIDIIIKNTQNNSNTNKNKNLIKTKQ